MTGNMGEEVDGRPATFGATLKELRELMEHRGDEGYNKIQQSFNGVLELCKALYTSPNEGKQCGFSALFSLLLQRLKMIRKCITKILDFVLQLLLFSQLETFQKIIFSKNPPRSHIKNGVSGYPIQGGKPKHGKPFNWWLI